jgi:hypothetical protein
MPGADGADQRSILLSGFAARKRLAVKSSGTVGFSVPDG